MPNEYMLHVRSHRGKNKHCMELNLIAELGWGLEESLLIVAMKVISYYHFYV